MKSLIFLMVAAALFAGGLFYVASDKTLPPPTAEELAALIKMEDPSIEGAAVSIDKCRLSIKNELPAGDDDIGACFMGHALYGPCLRRSSQIQFRDGKPGAGR
ncbi:hypothetical protein [Roseibium sp.]|uniref:hypothetical protein n=1 Tax=Roseibium sp. TaxID=1936156 RepID=UPI003D0B63F4